MRCASPIVLAALALGVLGCPPPPEPQPPPGPTATPDTPPPPAPTWKAKDFTKATEGCTQLWTCDCGGVPAKSGCRVEPTKDDTTTGVCAAESGPLLGCTRCMALPPAAACECKEVCP